MAPAAAAGLGGAVAAAVLRQFHALPKTGKPQPHEYTLLAGFAITTDDEDGDDIGGRGLHSSTFQLNLSALYGIGGARRGCVARVEGMLGAG
jgi:hypothetical protein